VSTRQSKLQLLFTQWQTLKNVTPLGVLNPKTSQNWSEWCGRKHRDTIHFNSSKWRDWRYHINSSLVQVRWYGKQCAWKCVAVCLKAHDIFCVEFKTNLELLLNMLNFLTQFHLQSANSIRLFASNQQGIWHRRRMNHKPAQPIAGFV